MVSSIFLLVIVVTVYVDVLIIINTLVNYFMLLAVRKLTRAYTPRLRIALGAFAGGASSMLIFLENLGLVMTLLKLLTAVLMVMITFGAKPFKSLVKKVFWLFAISFIFGGLMFAVYIFFDTDIMLYTNGIIYFDIDVTFLVVCTVFSYIVITVITKFTDKKAPKSQEYYVTIQQNGKTVSGTALMDTGNSLREPFSSLPVVMVEKEVFNKFNISDEKIRIIPVSTVNGDSLIKAFRPEYLQINEFKTDKVYIGESVVSHEEYKIILNINLEGEMQNVKA